MACVVHTVWSEGVCPRHVSDVIFMAGLIFPSSYLSSLDFYVHIGYLKIVSVRFYLNEQSVLELRRFGVVAVCVFNACVLTVESLTSVATK